MDGDGTKITVKSVERYNPKEQWVKNTSVVSNSQSKCNEIFLRGKIWHNVQVHLDMCNVYQIISIELKILKYRENTTYFFC